MRSTCRSLSFGAQQADAKSMKSESFCPGSIKQNSIVNIVNNILLVGLPGTGIGHKLAVLYNNDF